MTEKEEIERLERELAVARRHIADLENRDTGQDLREDNERLRIIFDSINDGVFIHECDTGALVDVNLRACEMYGYPHDEVLLLKAGDSSAGEPPYTDEEAHKRVRLAAAGEPQLFEWLSKHKSGRLFWVEVSLRRTTIGGRDFVLGTVRDIAGRKEAEDTLRFAQFIMDKASEAVHVISPDGRLTYVNDAQCEMLGYSRDELLGLTISDLDRAYTPEVHRKFWERLRRKGALSFETFHKRKNGTEYPIEVRANYLVREGKELSVAFSHDITERRLSEEALKESEERFHSLFRYMAEGVALHEMVYGETGRAVDYRIIDVNPAYERHTGITRRTAVGSLASDLYGGGRPPYLSIYSTVAATGKSYSFEARHESMKRDFHVSAFSPKKGRFATIFNDITSQKRLESQLRQAQKMEAVGTLAGGIAHDFNNILTVISGYGSLLKMAVENTSPLRSYIDPILASTEKAANLTKSLLAFSRQQPVSLTSLNLNREIKATEKLLKRLLPEDVELKTILAAEDVVIMADPTQLEQILFNLGTNARDAMQRGGALTIETGLVELDEDFIKAYGYGAPGMYARLSVSDTGLGMDAATQEKIFDPFFTTKELGKGTGLGLSTVYGVMKQHNGFITVYSEPGAGTTFRLYFPALQSMTFEKKPAPPELRRGNETILVAEDNGDVRRLIRSILTKYGYTVLEAVDGQDAVDRIRTTKRIDLVILDSVMPKKNGREVWDEARTVNPGIRVIFTSGYTRDVVLDKGIETKEVDFISKPIAPDEMLAKVREILDR
ncbi:MAG TPA: PAS domain S-box protein [Syntrophorhabdaceae bacterium]|jgi:PAS domain S-box-containing protein